MQDPIKQQHLVVAGGYGVVVTFQAGHSNAGMDERKDDLPPVDNTYSEELPSRRSSLTRVTRRLLEHVLGQRRDLVRKLAGCDSPGFYRRHDRS